MAVYSTQFFAGVPGGTSAFVTFYTVPAGKVAVIRDVELLELQAGFTRALRIAGGPTFMYEVSSVANRQTQWRGDLVVPAGQTMQYYIGTGLQLHLIVSGFLLTS